MLVRKASLTLGSLGFAFALSLAACSDHASATGVASPAARVADAIGSDVAYGALDYNLTSFDLSTLALTATSNLVPPNPVVPPNPIVPPNPVRNFTATFTTDTRFVSARLDSYTSADPTCSSLASDYNASLAVSTSDGGLFYGLIGDMATTHCNARVLVDLQTATIRSFQPVP